jgi:hypothetical protein
MPTFTWDHVHLRTPDPEGMAQWFEHMFGAEVIRTTQQGKPRIDIKLGGAMIFTAQVTPGDGVNPPPTTPIRVWIILGLPSRESTPSRLIAEKRASSSPRSRTAHVRESRSAFCAGHKGSRSNCSTGIQNIPDKFGLCMPLLSVTSVGTDCPC